MASTQPQWEIGRASQRAGTDRVVALDQAAPDRRPARVLVSGDDAEPRCRVGRTLRDEGFEVVDVRSGWDLLEYLVWRRVGGRDEPRLDLLVADVRMGSSCGLEILAGLRELDWPTPVILMTAFVDAELRAEAQRLGVLAVLHEPFSVRDLCGLARSTVDAPRAQSR